MAWALNPDHTGEICNGPCQLLGTARPIHSIEPIFQRSGSEIPGFETAYSHSIRHLPRRPTAALEPAQGNGADRDSPEADAKRRHSGIFMSAFSRFCSARIHYYWFVPKDDRSEFKRVRLTGARFEGGRLPVDSLVELQKYQEIVRIAAEAEWKGENPGQDAPLDLLDAISLTIERIDVGSADIFLAFEHHQEYAQYQEDAQEAASAVLAAAYSGEEVPDLPGLSASDAYGFRTIVAELGSTLGPDQAIEYYPHATGSTPITISADTRKHALEALLAPENFLLPSEQPEELPSLTKENVSLVGKVTALDTDKQTYKFTLQDGRKLLGHYR